MQTCVNGIRKSYTAPTKAELMELVHGKKKKPKKPSLLFRDAVSKYIDSCRVQGCSPSTIAGYTTIARNAFGRLVNTPVDAITADMVQEQLNERAADHSPKTIRNEFYLISAVCKVYAPDLDLSRIKINRRKKPPRKIYRAESINDILQAIKNENHDFRVYVLLILFAGLRPSEVYALRWKHLSSVPTIIDGIKLGSLTVEGATVRDELGIYTDKPPKTDAGYRTQLISWTIFREIYRIKTRTESDERIVSMKPNSVTRKWIALRKQGVVPDIRLYDLRQMYATSVVYSGASEEELANRLGHSTSTFSHSVYVQIYAEHQSKVNANLAKFAHESILKSTNASTVRFIRGFKSHLPHFFVRHR